MDLNIVFYYEKNANFIAQNKLIKELQDFIPRVANFPLYDSYENTRNISRILNDSIVLFFHRKYSRLFETTLRGYKPYFKFILEINQNSSLDLKIIIYPENLFSTLALNNLFWYASRIPIKYWKENIYQDKNITFSNGLIKILHKNNMIKSENEIQKELDKFDEKLRMNQYSNRFIFTRYPEYFNNNGRIEVRYIDDSEQSRPAYMEMDDRSYRDVFGSGISLDEVAVDELAFMDS